MYVIILEMTVGRRMILIPYLIISDCENKVENNVDAKCLHPREILKQPKRFDN